MSPKTLTRTGSGAWIQRDHTGRIIDSGGNVDVVRNVTMPNGTTIRVVRKDALNRALTGNTGGGGKKSRGS